MLLRRKCFPSVRCTYWKSIDEEFEPLDIGLGGRGERVDIS